MPSAEGEKEERRLGRPSRVPSTTISAASAASSTPAWVGSGRAYGVGRGRRVFSHALRGVLAGQYTYARTPSASGPSDVPRVLFTSSPVGPPPARMRQVHLNATGLFGRGTVRARMKSQSLRSTIRRLRGGAGFPRGREGAGHMAKYPADDADGGGDVAERSAERAATRAATPGWTRSKKMGARTRRTSAVRRPRPLRARAGCALS
jgi:hypothetical protein